MNWDPNVGSRGAGLPDSAGGPGGFHEASPDPAKQSFLAAMSHELRTPLNAIIGFSEMMDAEVFGPHSAPQYGQYVRDILGSARWLLRIIEDVLEISRAQAGELVPSKHEVYVAQLVDEALHPFRGWCRARRIRIVTDVPGDIVIHVDPDKIRRVLASLISNAVKFSGDGSTVRIAATLDALGLVRVSIKDRGIGMDRNAIERAFVPFVQLDDALSRQFDGPGLGLSLARLLVELHDGRIEIGSAPGAGTTATVILPAYAAAAQSLRCLCPLTRSRHSSRQK